MTNQLNLKITEPAKERIKRFLEAAELDNPLPGLLLSMDTNDRSGGWHIGAYGQKQVQELQNMYAAKGFVLVYQADGIKLCLPQTHLISELEGKTLDYQGDHYVVE
jgi:hypothetical protein